MESRDDCRLEVTGVISSSVIVGSVVVEDCNDDDDENDDKDEEEEEEDRDELVSSNSVTQMPPASHSISLQELKFLLPLSLSKLLLLLLVSS